MRILLAHNYYQSSAPSGEDIAFENERRLLLQAGHEVICFTRHNDNIGDSLSARVSSAASSYWSRSTYRDVVKLISNERPTIAHFHNTFPLISAAGYQACRDRGVAVVQTLHNYRLICPGALLMRDGKPCEDCVGRSFMPAIQHRCYRHSRAGTALVSGMLMANRLRSTYDAFVDRYVCFTEFAKQRFIRGGISENKLVVRANALFDPPSVGAGNGNYCLFVGRLSSEKGIKTLVQAWLDMPDIKLKIVGDGPLRHELNLLATHHHARVEFLGMKPRHEVFELMRHATALIIPSECYEGFPNTVLEGLACGAPLIVSALGALNEILESPANCLKFEPGKVADLQNRVEGLVRNQSLRKAMSIANRTLFETKFSQQQAIRSLLSIYRSVLSNRHDVEKLLPESAIEA